jgi:hypothetical protein
VRSIWVRAEVTIIEFVGYALFGQYKGEVVYIDGMEISNDENLRESDIPKPGDTVKVIIGKEIEPEDDLPLHVSHEGKYAPRYVASIAHREKEDRQRAPRSATEALIRLMQSLFRKKPK